jgi:uncharacterized protein (DUF1330 family)
VFARRGNRSPLIFLSISMVACNTVILKAVYSLAMAVYVIVNLRIHDLAAYDAYKAGVVPMVSRHGGEYLARGGATEVLEGDWIPNRVVLLKFPEMNAVKAFLDDPEYADLKSLRHRIAHTQMVAVEGV